MDATLGIFVSQYVGVVIATLMLVFVVAFLSIPFTLGGHPGEPSGRCAGGATYALSTAACDFVMSLKPLTQIKHALNCEPLCSLAHRAMRGIIPKMC